MKITKERIIELLIESDLIFEVSDGVYSSSNREDTVLNPYIDKLFDLLILGPINMEDMVEFKRIIK
jgi:hypothetical protein